MNYSDKVKLLRGPRIDFRKLRRDFWKHRYKYYVLLPIAFAVALLYSIGLPNYYTCKVLLAPRLSDNSDNPYREGNIKANLFFRIQERRDALYPILFTTMFQSPEFIVPLFDIKVKRSSDNKEYSYYEYLLYGQKQSLWKTISNKIIDNGSQKTIEKINPFRLSSEQTEVAEIIKENIRCFQDKIKGTIIISVRDSDPLISAIIADSICSRLQLFLSEYRINKAKIDFEYNRKICDVAKKEYEQSRLEYSQFLDSNRDVNAEKSKMQIKKLEDNMQIRFNNYQRCYSKLIASELEIQYESPVFFCLKKPTVPLEKSDPARLRLCFKFLFQIFLIISFYVLYKERDLRMLIGVK